LRYEPSALTYHPVEEFRISQQYFLRWWFNKGRSNALEFGIQLNGKNILGIPLGLFRGLAAEAVRWTVTVEPSRRFVSKLKVWACAGEALESYRQSLDAKRKERERKANSSPPTEAGK
jgi:hypothetical protein